jgi:hypothetical protein
LAAAAAMEQATFVEPGVQESIYASNEDGADSMSVSVESMQVHVHDMAGSLSPRRDHYGMHHCSGSLHRLHVASPGYLISSSHRPAA